MRVKSGSCALLWLAVSSALLAAPRAPRAVRFPRVVARGQVSMSAVISRKAKKRLMINFSYRFNERSAQAVVKAISLLRRGRARQSVQYVGTRALHDSVSAIL